jgi:hypothetical protein
MFWIMRLIPSLRLHQKLFNSLKSNIIIEADGLANP